MAGKMGKRETGKKPTNTRRTSAKTDGAIGKEQVDDVKSGIEQNRDTATMKQGGKS